MVKTWIVRPSGQCYSPGIDFSQSDPHLVGLNTNTKTILVHEKGTKFWSGIGGNMYAPAEYQIYTYEEVKVLRENMTFSGCSQQLEAPTVRKDALEKVQEQLKNLRC